MKIIKWKYQIKIVSQIDFSEERLANFLTICGAKGWELVTINQLVKSTGDYYIIMKKPCGFVESEIL